MTSDTTSEYSSIVHPLENTIEVHINYAEPKKHFLFCCIHHEKVDFRFKGKEGVFSHAKAHANNLLTYLRQVRAYILEHVSNDDMWKMSFNFSTKKSGEILNFFSELSNGRDLKLQFKEFCQTVCDNLGLPLHDWGFDTYYYDEEFSDMHRPA